MIGDQIKGQIVTEASIAEIEPDDWLTQYFRPSLGQFAGSFGLIVLGFTLTLGIAHIGSDED